MIFLNLSYLPYILIGAILIAGAMVIYSYSIRTFFNTYEKTVRRDMIPVSNLRLIIRLISFYLAFCLFGIALLRPVWPSKTHSSKVAKLDLMIALDISPSMLTQDLIPDRLTRSKREINSLLKVLPGFRTGLVFFSGRALNVIPLTYDYAAISDMVDQGTPDFFDYQGTDLSAAIEKSLNALLEDRPKAIKTIVLLTDGEDHSKNLKSQIRRCKQNGTRIYPIGIGSAEGAPIPVYDKQGNFIEYKQDRKGKVIISQLDGRLLHSIAEQTGGTYIHVNGSTFNLRSILDTILKLETEKETIEIPEEGNTELYFIPLILGLCFLFLAAGIPVKRLSIFLIVFAILGLEPAHAKWFNGMDWIKSIRANQQFKKGKLQQSLAMYSDLLKDNSDTPELHYDLGNALSLSGQDAAAAHSWGNAFASTESDQLKKKIHYNRAIESIKKQDYLQARRNLIEVLNIDSTDIEAKQNLELVMERLLQKESESQGNPSETPSESNPSSNNQSDSQKSMKSSEQTDSESISEEQAEAILKSLENSKTHNPQMDDSRKESKEDTHDDW